MIKGFIVKKLGMTQEFSESGKLEAATICQAAPCYVVGRRTKENDGYTALQLAAGKKKNANKPMQGQLEKAKIEFVPAIIKEVKYENDEDKMPKIGKPIKVDQVIEEGTKVDVIGKTKGRGFTGVVKRWNFRTQPRTHGQKQRWRAPGAIGAQTPGRVIKGKKMPGHYGNTRVTIKNLEILNIDSEENEITVSGAVPGHKNGWLIIVPRQEAKGKDGN